MMNRLIAFLLIVALSFSCKTTKDVGVGGSLEGITLSDYFESLIENELDYKTLSYRMDAEFKMQSNSKSSKVTLKMNKNEAVQLSIQPYFGIETHRLTFTPDSVVFLDRLYKQYIAESITELREKNPGIDFSMIQALFANQLFVLGKEKVSSSDKSLFEMKKLADYVLLTVKNGKQLSFSFNGNPNSKIQTALISTNTKSFSMNWSYAGFSNFSNDLFPTKMDVNIQTKNKNMNASFSISKLEKNKEQQIDLSIPSKYKKIKVDNFLDILPK